MKLSTKAILFAGLSSVSATTERRLEEPCLVLEDLGSIPALNCTGANIVNLIKEELADLATCPHNHRQEAILLADASNFGEAKFILKKMCKGESYEPCTTWDDVELNGCDFLTIMAQIEEKVEELGESCPHDAIDELQLLTGTKNKRKAKGYIDLMCGDAWRTVEHLDFTDVDAGFDETFMAEYFDGGTFLNEETGNFQGEDNPAYPVSDQSKAAGESIDAFRNDGAPDTVLIGTPELKSCQNQAMMCCFGRDRQSNDNNGNCADNDCDDGDPADNSNLCFTDFPDDEVVPYPGESEGAIHCHGVAWGADDNGFEAKLKFNNLFYVSMYDHMYTRGYVEKTVDNDYVPMCGCIEDMPPVSRADCTEVAVTLTFTFSQDEDGLLTTAASDDLNVDFNECNGIDFDDGTEANNDLASYVNVLVADGKMKVRTQRAIFDTLVGFKEPDNNDNERKCKREYKLLTGLTYPPA